MKKKKSDLFEDCGRVLQGNIEDNTNKSSKISHNFLDEQWHEISATFN